MRWAGGFIALLAALYLGLLVANSLTRLQHFSPDSMVYVDVAQNLAAGRGLSQSVVVAYMPAHLDTAPLSPPLTTWAPLYPIAIAGLHGLGLDCRIAALLLAALGYAAVLGLAFHLTSRLFGVPAACLGAGFMALHFPLHLAATYAWSESLALALLLAGFCTLPRPGRPLRYPAAWAFLGGLCFGLAFAARYALLPAGFVFPLFLLFSRHQPGRWRSFLAWLGGYAPAAGAVLLRNLVVSGRLFGPPRPVSQTGLLENLRLAFETVSQLYLPYERFSMGFQWRLLLCLCLVVIAAAVLRRRVPALIEAFKGRPQAVLTAWFLGYTAFLLVYRSLYKTDPVGPRLLLPALVPLLVVGTGAIARVLSGYRYLPIAAGLLMLAGAFAGECHTWRSLSAKSLDAALEESERLRWIRDKTTEQDLIVGDSTMDIPMYCGFRHSIAVFPEASPEQHLAYADLEAFAARHDGRLGSIYLVFRGGETAGQIFADVFRSHFGPFVGDLMEGRLDNYPGIRPVAVLEDAHVFAFSPRPEPGE